jgi:hypothetical protein
MKKETKYTYMKVNGRGYEFYNNGEKIATVHDMKDALALEKTIDKKCKWSYDF